FAQNITMPRLLAILVTIATIAHAQHMNEKDSPCADISITSELTACFVQARDAADAHLNEVYKRLRDRLDTADAERLRTTQRLWIQYRDANWAAERDLYEGASASSAVYFACLEEMTRARTKELAITYAVKWK